MKTNREEKGKYFLLECFSETQWEFSDILDYPEIDGIISWISGSAFESLVPQPIKLQWDPETEGLKKSLYSTIIPLFRKDIVAALQEAGVDNLDSYAVEISDVKLGEISHDYVAVNIVGLVAAMNHDGSRYSDFWGAGLIDLDIDSLVIDSEKAKGFLMFRLAECVNGIVIARKVKEHLESQGGFGLTFVPPEEWIG